jgi:Na+/H+-dicarboxylate symporter
MSYIASAILSLEQKAPLLILTIILLVCASNILAAQAAYYVGIIGLPLLAGGKLVGLSQIQETITPLVSFPDMEILSPSFSMIIGMIYGLIFGIKRNAMAQNLAFKVRDFVTVLLQKSFIPLLPVYVFGFVLKMQKEGTLTILFENCGQIILLMCGFMLTYILLAYVLVYRGNPKLFIPALKNMFPPIFTGFTTMSSAATMPVTLVGVEKNLKDPQFAQLIVPTTVNIHMLGDTLGIPLLALAVLQLSGLPLPDTLTYLSFTLYFCITKFSVAGIPGGGVLVCLPILQEHLGLPPEMGPLVATLYILQDSIFTSSNVAGNGVFALICHRVLTRIRLVKQVPQIQEEAYAPLPESPDFYTQPKRKADL